MVREPIEPEFEKAYLADSEEDTRPYIYSEEGERKYNKRRKIFVFGACGSEESICYVTK